MKAVKLVMYEFESIFKQSQFCIVFLVILRYCW